MPAGRRKRGDGRRIAVRATIFYARLLPWQLALSVAWAAAAPGHAGAVNRTPREGVVRTVIDGDTVMLNSGAEVRLVGIRAPKPPPGRPGFKAWPLVEAARAALESLVLGQPVTLSYHGLRIDRHRRLLAHLSVRQAGGGEAVWVQGQMLSRGLARVYTFADNRGRAAEMLAAERAARAAGRGIWAHRFYRILRHDRTHRFLDTFQLVEGVVHAAAVIRGRAYLNFAADWRRDFTISIAPRDMRRFRRAGLEPGGLAGRTVRVRGWLHWRNGPMIDATHPEQLEVLDK